jgi:hypothetical protein
MFLCVLRRSNLRGLVGVRPARQPELTPYQAPSSGRDEVCARPRLVAYLTTAGHPGNEPPPPPGPSAQSDLRRRPINFCSDTSAEFQPAGPAGTRAPTSGARGSRALSFLNYPFGLCGARASRAASIWPKSDESRLFFFNDPRSHSRGEHLSSRRRAAAILCGSLAAADDEELQTFHGGPAMGRIHLCRQLELPFAAEQN